MGNIKNNSLAVSPDETIAVASYINNAAASTVKEIDLATQSVKKIITGFGQPRQDIK